VLSVAPGNLVSLYLGRGRPDQWQLPISQAISSEVCFLRCDELIHGVGYAIRAPLLLPLYTATVRSMAHSGGKIELMEAMSRWAKRKGESFLYTRPSIVNHLDGPTLCEHPDGQERTQAPDPSGTAIRKAWLFDARESWDSSEDIIPRPDLRRRDKVTPRHLLAVGERKRV
jgi:hypothetical protein